MRSAYRKLSSASSGSFFLLKNGSLVWDLYPPRLFRLFLTLDLYEENNSSFFLLLDYLNLDTDYSNLEIEIEPKSEIYIVKDIKEML
jgi:hypothetical protein